MCMINPKLKERRELEEALAALRGELDQERLQAALVYMTLQRNIIREDRAVLLHQLRKVNARDTHTSR